MTTTTELQALLDRATKGPWIDDNNEGFGQNLIWSKCTPSGNGKPGPVVASVRGDSAEAEANAALIAMAPDLAADVIRLRAELDATLAANAALMVRVEAARAAIQLFADYDASVDDDGVTMMLAYDDAITSARTWLEGKQ